MRSLSALVSVALVATLSAGGGLAAPADAVSRDVWTVPGDSSITIKGRGFGHGHGMSQYGAEGAARDGLTAKQIVDFYYPGTSWGASKGKVSVLLTADTSDDVVVRPRSGLAVHDSAVKGKTELPDNGARQWRIATARGVTKVAYLTKRWHTWKVLDGQGDFRAGGDPIRLVTPSGDRAYRGRIVAADMASGERVTVNLVSLENYLRGVVPLEIPASWSPAAVQAQAVAARTYASYERNHPQSSAYQICDTSSCQVYGGYDAEYPASNDAVDATRHQILLAGGEPAFTQFASSSGGWTSAGSVSYLPAKRDPYDGWSGNPVHTWTLKVDDGQVERTWPSLGNLARIAVTGRDGNGAWGGRVTSITLTGSSGKVTVSGDTFRSMLGLRSTWLTFKVAAR
ncbi:SpoIID/LytB domain-containing protein [Nocardioides sp. CN2-186]|uniref:SpoIID/LytB domain-containing protein n=1 Tax=Nocardioides tweenelious TaxID=3156607 RepID=UPI0032B545F5